MSLPRGSGCDERAAYLAEMARLAAAQDEEERALRLEHALQARITSRGDDAEEDEPQDEDHGTWVERARVCV